MKKKKNYNISRNYNNIEVDLNKLDLKVSQKILTNRIGNLELGIENLISKSMCKLNLGCKLNENILTLSSGKEIVFNERYYYIDNGIKVYKKENGDYITKEDIKINDDKTLSYDNKEINIDVKSDDGLMLRRSYEGFKNANEFELDDENIAEVKKEINSIKTNILNLKLAKKQYENELSEDYKKMIENQDLCEKLSYRLEKKNVDLSDDTKSLNEEYNRAKEEYVEYTKKEDIAIGGIVCNGSTISFDSEKIRFVERQSPAINYTKYASMAAAEDGDDYEQANTNLMKYYQEKYQEALERKSQPVTLASYRLEKKNYENNLILVDMKKELLSKQKEYLECKNKIDTNNDSILMELVELLDEQISYYTKELKTKEYDLSQLEKLIPESFVYREESYVLGFNKYGNLSMIFDSYDNKAIIEYDELNNIKKIVGSNEKTIDFKYENGLLKRIVDMDGKEVLFNYNDSNLTEIIYPNGDSVKYEYDNNLLTRIIDVSGTSLKIEYNEGSVYRLLDVSKNNKEKAICFFEIEGNETILTDSDTQYKTHYMFSDDSLVFEYTMLNDELIETINYEYESECCKFVVETNKKDEVIFEVDDFEVSNLKSFYLSAEINKMISSDYVLIALLQADSYEVSDRRKTDYCNHQKDNMTNSHFDIECVLLYDEDERKSFVATGDYKNKGMQVVSVPISLKEENGNVILPEDVYLGVNYSNNQGTCKVEKLLLVKATYLYQELDLNGNVVYEENNDCITPKLVNGVKEGYYITKKISERIYDETLLTKEISTIKYKEINLDRNLILSNTKQTEIKYTYNSNKKVSLIETSEGNITEYSYNESGMVISKKEYHKSNPLLSYYEENKYDEEGFLKEEKDELGNVIKYEYENSDVVRIINPNNVINYGYDKKTGNKVAVSINVDDESLYNELEYNNGNVSKLVSNSNEYEYIYDDFNRLNEIKINGNTYVKFETEKVSGKRIEKTIYNNSKGFVKIYDNIGKLLEFNKLIDDVEIKYMKYEYDEFDQLIKEIDLINNKEKIYNYEEFSLASSNLGYIYNEEYDYKNNLIKKNYDNNTYDYIYEDDLLKKVKYNDEIISEYSYDKLRRIKVIENELIKDEYTYLTRNTNTTSLVTSVKKKVGNSVDHIKYKYDLSGNIINIKSKDNEISYKYDNAGRLIREDNKLLNKTFIYEYDNAGNILYKKKYDYSQNDILENEDVIEYNYDKDLLVNINNEAVTYDSLNNPVTYKDNILKWDLKNLIRFNDISFEYDSNGIRTIKQYNNYKHFYELDGSRIIKETIKSYDEFESPINSDQEYGLTEMGINYIYSSEGIVGFETSRNGVIKRYFYNKNILGDILEIYDNENKELVAKYVYDAYGNHEILVNKDNIANINPFRYRGYYYDVETGLYYCNYRYYSPKLCRWISPDSIEYLDPESINGLIYIVIVIIIL